MRRPAQRPRVTETNPEALDALVWTPRFLAAMDKLVMEVVTDGNRVAGGGSAAAGRPGPAIDAADGGSARDEAAA